MLFLSCIVKCKSVVSNLTISFFRYAYKCPWILQWCHANGRKIRARLSLRFCIFAGCGNEIIEGKKDIYAYTASGTTNTEQYESPGMRIYPNPVRDMVNIVNPGTDSKLIIRSISGKVVYEARITNSDNRISVDLSHQPSGVYILEIRSDQAVRTEKIIKN
jgi:hypothetical protein